MGRVRTRFMLKVGSGAKIAFLGWSAGQREETPLFLMLGPLFAILNKKLVVVIEEPESGLHPEAIRVMMATLLYLTARGYRLMISTHSPLVLETFWALRFIKRVKGPKAPKLLGELFGIDDEDFSKDLLNSLPNEFVKIYFFKPTDKGVITEDISDLPLEGDYWGGLLSFSQKANEVVAKTVSLLGEG